MVRRTRLCLMGVFVGMPSMRDLVRWTTCRSRSSLERCGVERHPRKIFVGVEGRANCPSNSLLSGSVYFQLILDRDLEQDLALTVVASSVVHPRVELQLADDNSIRLCCVSIDVRPFHTVLKDLGICYCQLRERYM